MIVYPTLPACSDILEATLFQIVGHFLRGFRRPRKSPKPTRENSSRKIALSRLGTRGSQGDTISTRGYRWVAISDITEGGPNRLFSPRRVLTPGTSGPIGRPFQSSPWGPPSRPGEDLGNQVRLRHRGIMRLIEIARPTKTVLPALEDFIGSGEQDTFINSI